MTNGYRGPGSGSRQSGGQGRRPGRDDGAPRIDTSEIRLKPDERGALPPDLFDGIARKVAQAVAANGRNQANKPSQIRQFYDELVMWEEKARTAPDRFAELLPFIRMLNAKAAYAKGRQHVDDTFVDFISCCVAQVEDCQTLRNFKTFFEAFLGFYKQEHSCG